MLIIYIQICIYIHCIYIFCILYNLYRENLTMYKTHKTKFQKPQKNNNNMLFETARKKEKSK